LHIAGKRSASGDNAAMHRRTILATLACWPATRLLAQDDAGRPRLKISAAQLRRSLAQRFPMRLALAGVLALRIGTPALALLPASQQLAAALPLQLEGAALAQAEAGELDVAFRLRYEPSDRTVRAHGVELMDVRWPTLAPDAARLARDLLPQLVREAMLDVELHRFDARDLALADTMGFEPHEIVVLADGLLVTFAPKPLR
jgi:hypothetical protein